MDILNEVAETKRALKQDNRTVSANMTALDLLDSAFQTMSDKEPVSFVHMDHEKLAKLADEYNMFIYKMRSVLQGTVDDWYNGSSGYLRGIDALETVEAREERLEKVHTLLKQRTTIEDFENISKQDIHDILFEYDCLLHDMSVLLDGDYNAFDNDMAYSKHVKKEV